MNDLLKDDGIDLPPQLDPNKNYLEELVGDAKKFKSPEDLAKGKYESDQYIGILTRRLDEMRQDYLELKQDNDTKAKLEDLINQVSEKRLASSENTPAKEDQLAMDPKQIESLVSTKFEEYKTSERQQGNYDLVKDKLQQRFGNNYKNVVKEQIDELGITEAELNEMARKTPKVLLRTLGLDQEPQRDNFQSPPRTNQRSDNFAPKGAQKRTWSYYQELKKKDSNAWLNRDTAIQMQKDAIELGEEFRDGDYYKPGLHERQ